MPIDAQPVLLQAPLAGSFVLEESVAAGAPEIRAESAKERELYLSHFATCPNASQHRKTDAG